MYRTFVRRPPAMETNEYEILPKNLSLDETPLQKLRRLMFEVQELNDEMEKAKVTYKDNGEGNISYLNDIYRNPLMPRKLSLNQTSFHKSLIFSQIW